MSIKRVNLVVIPTASILLVFRFFHLFFGTDSSTGFSNSIILDIVLYSLLAALLLFVALNFYYGRFAVSSSNNKKSKLVCYSVIIFAVICEFMSVVDLLENKYLYLTDNSNIMLANTIKKICAILGVLVGICIVFESVKAMSLSSYTPNLLVCCILVLYFITVLFTYYATHYTIVTISQNLLGMFFWMAATIFVYAFLRYQSNSKTINSYKLSLIFGYFSSICGLLVTIPRVVTSLFVDLEFNSFNSMEQLMILPTTIVIIIITYKLANATKSEEN